MARHWPDNASRTDREYIGSTSGQYRILPNLIYTLYISRDFELFFLHMSFFICTFDLLPHTYGAPFESTFALCGIYANRGIFLIAVFTAYDYRKPTR